MSRLLCLAALWLPFRGAEPSRLDQYGDPLPFGAVARLGTVRFNTGPAIAIAYDLSPDGRLIASASGNTLRLWNLADGREVRTIVLPDVHEVGSVRFAPDGKHLLLRVDYQPKQQLPLLRDNAVYLCDAATGKVLRRFGDGRTRIKDVAFLADGHFLAVLEQTWPPPADGRGTLRLWDTSGREVGRLEGIVNPPSDSPRRGLAFSPDGRTFAWSDSEAGFVYLDDRSGAEPRRLRASPSESFSFLAFTPDGKKVVAGRRALESPVTGGCVRVWDVATGKEQTPRTGHQAAVVALTFSPDGRRIASQDAEGVLRLWDGTGRQLWPAPNETGPTTARFGFTADGALLVQLDGDGVVRLREASSGKLVRQRRVAERFGFANMRFLIGWEHDFGPGVPSLGVSDPHECQPGFGAAFGPGNRTLAVVGPDGHVHLWDLLADREIQVFRTAHREWAMLLLSPDGRFLVTDPGMDERMHLWDTSSGKIVATRSGKGEFALLPSFSPDGALLAWGYPDALHLWDCRHGREGVRLERPLRGDETDRVQGRPHFIGDGLTVVALGVSGVPYGWDTETGVVASLREEWDYDCVRLLRSSRAPGGRVFVEWTARGSDRLAVPGEFRCEIREFSTGRLLAGHASPSAPPCVVSPDGRLLAAAPGRLSVLELSTGGRAAVWPGGHRGPVSVMTFSPDGRLLATGGADGTILLWDWADAAGFDRAAERPFAALWDDLADRDAAVGQEAVAALARDPQTVRRLVERLRKDGHPEAEALRRLLADLGSEEFRVRERAGSRLAEFGPEAEPALRRALDADPELEVRRRIEAVLPEIRRRSWAGEGLRRLRAVQVLERIRTAEARETLRRFAAADPDAVLTHEARDALRRMDP
jgi:WD40 repeat protein